MVYIDVGKPMSIQDISISNNQHKQLIKAVPNDSILVKGDDGELIVNVSEYQNSKLSKKNQVIELIIGDKVLDPKAHYWVFK
jgi:hypothetical protein